MSKTGRPPVGWLVIGVFVAGCGDAPQGPVEFTAPDLESSKTALVVTLDAWKADRRASGVLIGAKPAIGVVDSMRVERPLIDFEIVGPLMVVGKARPFAVRLVLDSPRETVMTRYLVLGVDPLWVYREEDFERMLHWEHKMDSKEAADPSSKPPALQAPVGR